MMPPADPVREQNEQDPGRIAHIRQEAGSNDFLAVGPALPAHPQRNVEGLSAAKHSIIRNIADRHNVNVICLQETHADAACAYRFLPCDAMLAQYMLQPCVCLSQVGVLLKWLNIRTHDSACHTTAKGLLDF